MTGSLLVSTIVKPGVKFWGDAAGFFNGVEWTPPNLTTTFDDAVVMIKTWLGGPVVAPISGANVAHPSVADVDPGDINLIVNFNYIFKVVQAFTGAVHPFGPADANGTCP